MRNTIPRVIAVAVAGVTAIGLTGCIQAPAPTSAGAAHSTKCPVAADSAFTGTLRVAYQAIPNADLIVKNDGLLEACLPKATVKWSQFSSGGDVVQAFGAGSLDLGLAGSSPSTKAVSAPLNLGVQIVWTHDVIGTAESLIARDPKDTGIRSLRGKKIAVPFGSTSHFSLLRALQTAGLTDTDVKLVNLEPEKMPAAWQTKQIDAAWVWDPVQSQLKSDGGTAVLSSADTAKDGAPTFDMEIASKSFIAANPKVMQVWTGVEDFATKGIKSDPSAAAEAIAGQLGIKPAAVKAQFAGYTYPDAKEQSTMFHKDLPAVLLQTAGFLKSQGGVDAVNADYAPGLYSTAIDAVAK